MKKEIVCIECPVGCLLSVDLDGGMVRSVEGNKCAKGAGYAAQEAVEPMRILTASVVCRKGLSLNMLPVRSSKPIPRKRQMEAMQKIRQIVVNRPCRTGDIVAEDFLGIGVHLVATRDVEEHK